MTYTKQVREYCENHMGTIIDASKVKDTEFAEIPYKMLLKILNRLEEEKIVTSAIDESHRQALLKLFGGS